MPSSRREMEEDMLEELCSLAKKNAQVTIPEICGRMEMTRREVLACLKQLTAQGYVKTEEKNTSVCLTELGRIRGEECRHRHETFTQFLEYVGVGSRTAEEDACRMEHVASEETVQQICNFVNYGSTFERVLRNTDLRYRLELGEYSFLMGIYYMEKTCPRRLAGEFKNYKDEIDQNLIYITEKYLYNAVLRNVAIIISRKGFSYNARKAATGILTETGKLIKKVKERKL